MEKYYVNSKIKSKLYKILEDVTKLLDKKGIEYWVNGGTLLGVVRHKGLIPWDDDLDIAVLNTSKNINKIKSLEESLKKINLGLTKVFYGYKIYDINGIQIRRNLWREHKEDFKKKNPNIRGRAQISKHASKTYKGNKILYEKYRYPFLDIFLTKSVNDNIEYLDKRWYKCKFKKQDLFPTKKRKFGNLLVKSAKNPNNYLDGCYGKDWKDTGVITYNHKLEKSIKPIKFKLGKKSKKKKYYLFNNII